MKFGKEIQANQIPGWSQYYLDYKALKKIVSSLEASRSSTSTVASGSPLKPGDIFGRSPQVEPPVTSPRSDAQALFGVPSSTNEDDRGPVFQAHKIAFFFKLERELEKINAFYLQKEAELKMRLAILLSKRKSAAQRRQSEDIAPYPSDNRGVEWRAVEEGFRLLERDLGKLQQFIEVNATGFRKILKKWDRRSKSRTKEMYLTSQVEVQPCFNRELLTQLADTVATCLLDLTNVSIDSSIAPLATDEMLLTHQLDIRTMTHQSAFRDLETEMTKAITLKDEAAVREVLALAESLLDQPDAKTHITRILWKAAIEAVAPLADVIMASKAYDMNFVDDINGRRCIHGAAIAGELRLVNVCLERGIAVDAADFYGRTALHYASMNGHDVVCRRLLSLSADPRLLDMDNYNALIYAIINGKVECVRALLESPLVSVEPSAAITDLIPLSLACQHGHLAVATLLLQHGARRLPNTNGEYPIHLAAREGHADLCRMLVMESGVGGIDMPDKYSEWTPLFHAARHGHTESVKTLLEAECNPHAVDEIGRTPVFYAAWYGHIPCVELLLSAMERTTTPVTVHASKSQKGAAVSPLSDLDLGTPASEGEGEMIPSLSLPPPIMPFRIYGHSYLEKTCLIQIALGHPFVRPPISLSPPPSSASLLGSETSTPIPTTKPPPAEFLSSVTGIPRQQFQHRVHSGPSLKLVMTANSTSGTGSGSPYSVAPHSVTLPLEDEKETFSFQPTSLDDLSLEFSFYPSLGSKPIGRAVALSSMLKRALMDKVGDGSAAMTLPILDHRLHVIGQVSFEACVITPFSGVKLEIGGAVETYWKSTAMVPSNAPGTQPLSMRMGVLTAPSSLPRSLALGSGGSNANSPSLRSIAGATTTVTQSSLTGDYVHAVVQVTRDWVPVICGSYTLPVAEGFDMAVCDLTAEQFLRLAKNGNREVTSPLKHGASVSEWHALVEKSLMTLERLLKALPGHLGVSLELGFPSQSIRQHYQLGQACDLNTFLDVVLSTLYQASGPAGGNGRPTLSKRKIVFSSFEPNVCIGMNWKQPNYPVFFASNCGLPLDTPGGNQASPPIERDTRCYSVDAAVDFAKSNHLLGILVNAALLARVPSLVTSVKDTGVVLAAFGSREHLAGLNASASPSSPTQENSTGGSVDAFLMDGVLSYSDHPSRTV